MGLARSILRGLAWSRWKRRLKIAATCLGIFLALLTAAGFYVARGRNAGEKEETTIAFTPKASRVSGELLSAEWLGRWHRSHAKFPRELHPDHHRAFEQLILAHQQFQQPEHANSR